jgi:hypothetical protein
MHYIGEEKTYRLQHKVLTYTEYRAVSGVFRTFDPSPPLHPASVSSPAPKAGGYAQSPGGEGVGVNISEDARQYNPSTDNSNILEAGRAATYSSPRVVFRGCPVRQLAKARAT